MLELPPVDPSKFRKDYASFGVQLNELLRRCGK